MIPTTGGAQSLRDGVTWWPTAGLEVLALSLPWCVTSPTLPSLCPEAMNETVEAWRPEGVRVSLSHGLSSPGLPSSNGHRAHAPSPRAVGVNTTSSSGESPVH